MTFAYRGERHFSAARGVLGGRDGTREAIPSKTVTRLMRGDRVAVQTAGGAGYGDPAARDAAEVAMDLADGKVAG